MQTQNNQNRISKGRFTNRKSTKIALTQRLSVKKTTNSVKQIIKIDSLQFIRQNPIKYLQNLQQTHRQVQKNLQTAHKTSCKWRDFKSANSTPNSQQEINNIFYKTMNKFKGSQEFLIKTYNHVHNKQNMNFQTQQYCQLLKQAIHKSTIPCQKQKQKPFQRHSKQYQKHSKQQKSLNKSKQINQHYSSSQNRKQLVKLEMWIKNKIQTFKKGQKYAEDMILQRLQYLNIAFGQVQRIIGRISKQIKNILQYLHQQYYQYYNFLLNCMMNHNVNIKSNMNHLQDRLKSTILHYDQKINNIHKQNIQRSQRIVINFHKCIQVKSNLERENSNLKKNIKNQKRKYQFMEQGLIKLITFFLAIGQKNIQQLNILRNKLKEKQQNQKDKKNNICSQRQQFQSWCSYIMKMIRKITTMDQYKIKSAQKQTNISSHAYTAIQKYLVQNDTHLSVSDADNILKQLVTSNDKNSQLRKYLPTSTQALDFLEIQEKQKRERHSSKISNYQMFYRSLEEGMPTIHQLVNKTNYRNIGIQHTTYKQLQHNGIQTSPMPTEDVGVMTQPKTKTKQISTFQWMTNKLQIYNKVYQYKQVYRVKRQPLKKVQNIEKSAIKYIIPSQKSIQKIKLSIPSLSNIQISNQSKSKQHLSQQLPLNQYNFPQTMQIGINTESFQKLPSKKKIVLFNIQDQHTNQDSFICDKKFLTSKKRITSKKEIPIESSDQNLYDGQSDCSIEDGENFKKKLASHKRKNGFIIPQALNQRFSLKFIEDQSENTILSQEQLSQGPSHHQRNSQQVYNENEVDPSKNLRQKQKNVKFQSLQDRIKVNRSYFKLPKSEYASKAQAQIHRKQTQQITAVSKKKRTFKDEMIDPNQFHLQMCMKNIEKIRFLSSVSLWNPRQTIQMKKMRGRMRLLKPYLYKPTTIKWMSKFFTYTVFPVLKQCLKFYTRKITNKRSTTSQSKFMDKQENIFTYNHRLSPLFFLTVNYMMTSQGKKSNQLEMYFAGLKTLKQHSIKMEVFNMLMEGGTVEMDIFVKAMFQFNQTLTNGIQKDMQLSITIVQYALPNILGQYFTQKQIQTLINSLSMRSSHTLQKKTTQRHVIQKNQIESNIKPLTFFSVVKIILQKLRQKSEKQLLKYSVIGELISKNYQTTNYQDILYFLDLLPISSNKKLLILSQCWSFSIYWQKSQPSIPTDLLYFIFDKSQLYVSQGQKTDHKVSVIKEYIMNRCQLYLKGTLRKIVKSPEWVLERIYLINFKVPKVFHRLVQLINCTRYGKDRKIIYCLLTMLFSNLLDLQYQKKLMPKLFNGLIMFPIN